MAGLDCQLPGSIFCRLSYSSVLRVLRYALCALLSLSAICVPKSEIRIQVRLPFLPSLPR